MGAVARSNPTARALLWSAGVGILLSWLLVFQAHQPWAKAGTYVLLVPLLLSLGFAVRWWREGEKPASSWGRPLGLLLIVGGPLVDIGATMHHTPDLELEANPIARLLLDGGVSLTTVLAFATAAQGTFIAFQAFLWLGWFRHRRVWLASAWEQGRQSYLHFLKAATGAGQLGWRAWVLPLRPAELPRAFHVLATVTPALVIPEGLHRLYLGLQWFGLVPYLDELSLVAGLVPAGFAGLLVWLLVQYRRGPAA